MAKTKKLTRKKALIANAAETQKNYRMNLHQVYIHEGKIMASDGFMVAYSKHECPDQIMIPANAAKAIKGEAEIISSVNSVAVKEEDVITVYKRNYSVESANMINMAGQISKQIEMYDNLGKNYVDLDLKLLRKALNCFSASNRLNIITIYFGKPTEPIKITDGETSAIIMPCVLHKED